MNQYVFLAVLVGMLATPALSVETKTCSRMGLRCSRDCKRVEYCGEKDELPAVIRNCPESTFCGLKKGVPQCGATKTCNDAYPECTVFGKVPAIESCYDYTACFGFGLGYMDPFKNTCLNGEVFDVVTESCKKDVKCRKPLKCKKAGDYGVVDPETNIFCYYCKEKNSPYVYPCDPEKYALSKKQ